MRTIVLHGPGGAGKTTLGEALRSALGCPSALIDTDMFESQTLVRRKALQMIMCSRWHDTDGHLLPDGTAHLSGDSGYAKMVSMMSII